MDTLGQLLVDLKYEDIGTFQEGRLAVKRDNLWGFVGQNGQEIIPPQFQKIAPFSEGLAAVKYQRRWVFITKNGHIQLDDRYRVIGNFKEGKALFMKIIEENKGKENKAWTTADAQLGLAKLYGVAIKRGQSVEYSEAIKVLNGAQETAKQYKLFKDFSREIEKQKAEEEALKGNS